MAPGWRLVAVMCALLSGPAVGNEPPTGLPHLRDSMARFAQPVRVGDLPGRYVLQPTEAQRVLGRVAAGGVARTSDGRLLLLMDRGGVLGIGTTRVAVPMEEVAVLGEHVALVGLTPAALGALPAVAGGLSPLPPETKIRVAIVGPFH